MHKNQIMHFYAILYLQMWISTNLQETQISYTKEKKKYRTLHFVESADSPLIYVESSIAFCTNNEFV